MRFGYDVFTRREGLLCSWTVLVEDRQTSTLVAEMHGRGLTERSAYRRALAAIKRHDRSA